MGRLKHRSLGVPFKPAAILESEMIAKNVLVKSAFGVTYVSADIDDMRFRWNNKTKKFSMITPPRELSFRNGRKNGEIEKGQAFTGMTFAQFKREFGNKAARLFVETLATALENEGA